MTFASVIRNIEKSPLTAELIQKLEKNGNLTLKLDRVVAPPADLSPLTEIPPSPITEAVVEDDGISAED